MQFTTGLTAYQNVVKSSDGGVHWTRSPAHAAQRCSRLNLLGSGWAEGSVVEWNGILGPRLPPCRRLDG